MFSNKFCVKSHFIAGFRSLRPCLVGIHILFHQTLLAKNFSYLEKCEISQNFSTQYDV